MNYSNNSIRLLLMVTLLALFSESVVGQAYCALRDPVRRVYELFPEADSYRTIIATVGPEHRKDLDENLPFAHHFNEFGRHSLYVPLREGVPLGLIHVRSERGRWGLVEVCWALDLDLKVRGFEFQRCRDPESDALHSSQFATSLVGADLDMLKARMKGDAYLDSLPESQHILAGIVLRSGLKTVILTESVWSDELMELRAADRARALFGDEVYLESHSAIGQGSTDAGFKLVFRAGWGVRDGDGQFLGNIILTTLDLPGFQGDLWWVIGPGGRLKDVIPQRRWTDPRTERAFGQLKGRAIKDFNDCATAAELAAEAVLNKQGSP